MRKSLGSKRREIPQEATDEIARMYEMLSGILIRVLNDITDGYRDP